MVVQAKKTDAKKSDDSNRDKIFLYVGNDDAYWQTIQNRFLASYHHFGFKYISLYASGKPDSYLKAFVKILKLGPSCVYVDLSHDKIFHLRLAEFLTRENALKGIPIIGLVENQAMLRECISAKLAVIHVKCGEYHDVVFDGVRLAFPREVRKPEFARAKGSIDVELLDDCRIGFITPTSFHLEANFEVENEQEIELFHEVNKTLLPSHKMISKTRSTSNLYYEYQYAYDLDLKYLDDIKDEPMAETAEVIDPADPAAALKAQAKAAKEKAQEQAAKQLKASHESELIRIKKKFKQWVLSNMDDSNQKKTKILIIDRTLSILSKAEKPLDQYSYAIRFQSVMTPELTELDVIRPNLIAFNLEEFVDKDPLLADEAKQGKKDLENESVNVLSQIIGMVKSLDKYSPFIVVFNCTKYTSKSFQESYKYSLILTNNEPITIERVLEMADLYEEKQDVKTNQLIQNKIATLKKENISKYGRLTINDFKDQRYFIKKQNPISHAYVKHQAKIVMLCESELILETTIPLSQKTYRLTSPIEMSIAIVPDKDTGKMFVEQKVGRAYQGLIHGMGEIEKKKLRQFINEVFFIPLMEKREKEQEKFEELNKAVLEKKLAEYDRDDIREVPAPLPPPPPPPPGATAPTGDKDKKAK